MAIPTAISRSVRDAIAAEAFELLRDSSSGIPEGPIPIDVLLGAMGDDSAEVEGHRDPGDGVRADGKRTIPHASRPTSGAARYDQPFRVTSPTSRVGYLLRERDPLQRTDPSPMA
ncbi:MAG: hypothetical protein O3A19_13075 [Planctomycetota bacterium]|nr:hypothetical protein [Planctomycetota bacterium]MDA1027344.1 hypothetical protein [Planctomycetota bacterium]